jgi:hypothetical protein
VVLDATDAKVLSMSHAACYLNRPAMPRTSPVLS